MDMVDNGLDEKSCFPKWVELSIPSLRKIQKNVHPGLNVKDDALSYVNADMIWKLLRILMGHQPRSIMDVEERVKKTIPSPADKLALDKAHSIINELFPGSKKNVKKVINSSSISFPIQEVKSFLEKDVLCYKIDLQVTAFILAILEWVANDIFKLSGNYVKNCGQTTISSDDIKVAMCADNLLLDLFSNESETELENDGYLSRVLQSIISSKNGHESGTDGPKTTPPTYDECVKELIHEEQQFIKDLNLIIKVFREPFVSILTRLEESSSMTNSLPSSPTSLTTPTNSGQWSVPSSPTHKTPTMISQKDIDVIFSNILEVVEFSVSFLCLLEDALEATSNDEHASGVTGTPRSGIESIGACFEEAAENVEFDVFVTFAQDVIGLGAGSVSQSQERLSSLLQDVQLTNSLNTRGGGFLLAVRYVLPKLLNGVVYHCFTYFDYIKILRQLSPSEEDKESFSQAEGAMHPLRQQLERITHKRPAKFGENYLRLYSSEKRRNSSASNSTRKIHELVRNIEGVDQNHNQFCNEFILDGVLGKISGRKHDIRSSERHAFLFDGLLLLCKPASTKRSSSLVTSHHHLNTELKLKEKYFIRKIDLVDHPETDTTTDADNELRGPGWGSLMSSAASWTTSTTSLASTITNSVTLNSSLKIENLPRNAFEISSRDQSNHVILFAKTHEEKMVWMSNLILLSTKSMLERQYDSIIGAEEKNNPLKIPSVAAYKFAEADSELNILFEENKFNNSGVQLIRGATLIKLIERLTFHQHADPMFVRIFLTTYRSFCSPEELLVCLIERFDIPDIESSSREELKRFKKEYCQPIQFRVLNVIRHWVDHHYYDFARDPELLQELVKFLEKLLREQNNMKKWVDSILKTVNRKKDFSSNSCRAEVFTFNGIAPPVEWWLTRIPDEFSLLTLHPVEFGRQLTLHEFELFRCVKPSELVGCAWTKKDKEKTSPNLLKMSHFSTAFTYYLEKQIVDTENFEERVALVSRIIEIMQVLQRYNNFNGMLEIVAAINSAAVHRLEHTLTFSKGGIAKNLKRALDEAAELTSEHNRKYQEQLRSINPPCVPFLGMYQTNIVHIEEGNSDNITVDQSEGASLINFSKRRMVAEITGEIQQYQDTPYCLTVERDIKGFLENLNPLEEFASEKEFIDYLYEKSLEIEPRGVGAPTKYTRKWPDQTLKSPGIKPPTIMSTLSRAKVGIFPASMSSSGDTPGGLSSSILQQVSPTPTVPGSYELGPLPQSPSTPLTPPPLSSGSTSDHSVFAHVIIGGGCGQSIVSSSAPPMTPTFSLPPTPNPFSAPSGPPPPLPPMTPPPLPPRTQMRPRMASSSNSERGEEDSPPPPLPPRGIPPTSSRLYGRFQRSASSSTSSQHASFDSSPNVGHHAMPSPLPFSQVTPPPHINYSSSLSSLSHRDSFSRRNSAMDMALAPPPTPRRHSAVQAAAVATAAAAAAAATMPVHPPPPPPPATLRQLPPALQAVSLEPTSEEDPGVIPQLPPRTYQRPAPHLLVRQGTNDH